MTMQRQWKFRVCGYPTAAYAQKIGVRIESKLVETMHVDETSAAVEVEAWQRRMRKGEVRKVELIDMRIGRLLTNMDVQADTQIPWSWKELVRHGD